MDYSQKKVTGSDKKIQDLKTQLYGKQYVFKGLVNQNIQTVSLQKANASVSNLNTQYLAQDLGKSFILAVFVIAAQLLIFLGNSKGLLKFY